MNKNIDRITEAIERLRQPLDVKGREEDVIRTGPGNAGLQHYLVDVEASGQCLGRFNKLKLEI